MKTTLAFLLLAIGPVAAGAADLPAVVGGVQRGDVVVTTVPPFTPHAFSSGPAAALLHRSGGYTFREHSGSVFVEQQGLAFRPPVVDTPRGIVGQLFDPTIGLYRLATVGPSGRYEPFGTQRIPWPVQATAVAPVGTGIVLAVDTYDNGVKLRTELWRFDAAGNLVDTMLLFPGQPFHVTDMDIAADRCTLFYVSSLFISRYDICRHEELSDFSQTYVRSLRILPDGGVVAIDNRNILRFDAKGRLLSSTRSPLLMDIDAFALDIDPAVVWITSSFAGGSFYLVPMKIETGALVGDLAMGGNIARAVDVVGGWRAAVNGLPPTRHRAVR